MNLILERTDRVPYFTDMRRVLNALGVSAADFDWYLSNVETNCYVEDLSPEGRWIAGEHLERILADNEVQFVWAVFSAVPKGYRSHVAVSPYADGNPDYWSGTEVAPQLEGALFEIVCWDSCATILIGLPPQAQASFRAVFPDTKPLSRAG